MLAGRPDRRDVLALLGVERRALQQVGHAEHAVQRRADLVADVRHEFALGATAFLRVILRAPQFVLDGAALGDVGDRTDHPDGAARRVEHGLSDAAHPHVEPVDPLQPELLVEHGARMQAAIETRQHALAVVGMHAFLEDLGHRLAAVGTGAQDLLPAFRPRDGPRGDVPVPDAFAGGRDDDREALLVGARPLLRGLDAVDGAAHVVPHADDQSGGLVQLGDRIGPRFVLVFTFTDAPDDIV